MKDVCSCLLLFFVFPVPSTRVREDALPSRSFSLSHIPPHSPAVAPLEPMAIELENTGFNLVASALGGFLMLVSGVR